MAVGDTGSASEWFPTIKYLRHRTRANGRRDKRERFPFAVFYRAKLGEPTGNN